MVHIFSLTYFGGHLTFTRAADRERYAAACTRKLIPYKYIHDPTLDLLNIRDVFARQLAAIGWIRYVAIILSAFTELTWDFYATFEFNIPDEFSVTTPGVVRFRLMGREFTQSITEFNLALGFIDIPYSQSEEYMASSCEYTEPFFSHNTCYWKELSIDRQNDPIQSKASFLKNPAYRYLHRFMAYSFSGRKDSSGILTKPKFFFIWYMVAQIKINLDCWFTSHLRTVLSKKNKLLILVSFITQLTINLGVLDLTNHNLHLACTMEPLDLVCLEKMGLV